MVKNMAQDVYLYRKDRRWQKASKVIDVTMTSNQTAYASVTGVASTNIVTVTGATLADGQILTLSAKTGGSGVSLGVGYYIINASGATGQLSLTPGGSVVALGTNISAGSGIVSQPDLCVWSSEYRDTFTAETAIQTDISEVPTSGLGSTWTTGQPISSPVAVIPTGLKNYQNVVNPATPGLQGIWTLTADDFTASVSDEINHHPLRQNLLKRSFWKFDRGASAAPRYLYAEYMIGDQILDNPPETL